ncbi:MAG TPA: galactokinase [Phnomibacter sp.]|nr:galactokinase [Phnomibacter sp.]
MNRTLAEDLLQRYRSKFSGEPRLIFSPGRINLLGEHIDYNDGFVLPAAIQLGIYAWVAPSGDDLIEIFAKDFNELLQIRVADIGPSTGWKNYVLSVLDQFRKRGMNIGGFRMVLGSDLPIGSGLSSSAALEGAISYAVNELSSLGLSAKELALIGQAAEHDYPGVQCGIMDQFANMLGQQDHIVRIDCRSQETDLLPLELETYTLVLIYSNVQHALTGGEYNERRQQCRDGLQILEQNTGIRTFREAGTEHLEQVKELMSEKVYARCRYVVDEIQRTHLAAEYLKAGAWSELGQLMYATHDGLSRLYEVSLPEIDWLVDFARHYDGVLGSRLMGGGFGGCTLNLVKKDKAASFAGNIVEAYEQQWHLKGKAYAVSAENGTGWVNY